ncbi:hypothetical protein LMG19083_03272 [Ralstonia psammae]|uniref:Uncharacterized protein n=1 Tax=Ralstonia psammae TaxID=3058598 RepID=A0ABN9J1S4_9RALS|nr:hypothetical protein [Ralstonia sp. LMG 19083]CAJ0799251.1 hypothetical protein LMG19083_03272 [Ralstonia sp. LMG 19083]
MDIGQAHLGAIEIWNVQLRNHEPYSFTRLKRVFLSDDSRHRVVMVDASKLLTCADRDTTDYVLPRVENWYPGKVRGLREFLDPNQVRIPEMPYVTIKTRNRRTLLGLVGLDKEGLVSFRNGQHRARYMAFAGATRFPVEVHETEVALLERYCAALEEDNNDGAPPTQDGDLLSK